MSLCEHCKIAQRISCEGQEGWDETESKFNDAYERIKQKRDENSDLPGVDAAFERTKKQMVARRSGYAKHYQTIARRRRCTILQIKPFAE